eukprot:s215_g4.t1
MRYDCYTCSEDSWASHLDAFEHTTHPLFTGSRVAGAWLGPASRKVMTNVMGTVAPCCCNASDCCQKTAEGEWGELVERVSPQGRWRNIGPRSWGALHCSAESQHNGKSDAAPTRQMQRAQLRVA